MRARVCGSVGECVGADVYAYASAFVSVSVSVCVRVCVCVFCSHRQRGENHLLNVSVCEERVVFLYPSSSSTKNGKKTDSQ